MDAILKRADSTNSSTRISGLISLTEAIQRGDAKREDLTERLLANAASADLDEARTSLNLALKAYGYDSSLPENLADRANMMESMGRVARMESAKLLSDELAVNDDIAIRAWVARLLVLTDLKSPEISKWAADLTAKLAKNGVEEAETEFWTFVGKYMALRKTS